MSVRECVRAAEELAQQYPESSPPNCERNREKLSEEYVVHGPHSYRQIVTATGLQPFPPTTESAVAYIVSAIEADYRQIGATVSDVLSGCKARGV